MSISAALNTSELTFLNWLDNWGRVFHPPYIKLDAEGTTWLGTYSLQDSNSPGRPGRQMHALIYSDRRGELQVHEKPVVVFTVELTQLAADRTRVDIEPGPYMECVPVLEELMANIGRDYHESGFGNQRIAPQVQDANEAEVVVDKKMGYSVKAREDTLIKVAIVQYAIVQEGYKRQTACGIVGIHRNTYGRYRKMFDAGHLIAEAERLTGRSIADLWKDTQGRK